ALPSLRGRIRFGARVTAVTRVGFDKVRTQGRLAQPFLLHVAAAAGGETNIQARAVIDASGTWNTPNPAGADGLPALVGGDDAARVTADQLIVATGFRPDLAMLREIRLTLDPWLESSGTLGSLIDPNLHSCGTVRPHGAAELTHAEPGFFIVGMKSYGR